MIPKSLRGSTAQDVVSVVESAATYPGDPVRVQPERTHVPSNYLLSILPVIGITYIARGAVDHEGYSDLRGRPYVQPPGIHGRRRGARRGQHRLPPFHLWISQPT